MFEVKQKISALVNGKTDSTSNQSSIVQPSKNFEATRKQNGQTT